MSGKMTVRPKITKWVNCMDKFHERHRILENKGNKFKVK